MGESSRKKEFERRLAYINCRRGFVLSLAVAVFLPCLWYMNNRIWEVGAGFIAMVIVAESVELVSAALILYVLASKQRFMYIAYRAYYICTMAVLTIVCIMDYRITGSSMLYVLIMGIAVLVPVLTRKELKAYSCMMLVAAAAASIYAADNGPRAVVDMAVTGVLAFIAGRCNQERSRNYERIKDEYKEKTLCSEQDQLTGLASRRELSRRTGMLWSFCIKTHTMAGIIAIDVDYFNKYNDRFGHREGDKCLKRIAAAIEATAGRHAEVVARMGGEEFLVFVRDMSKKDIIRLGLEIREAVAELRLEQAYLGVSKYVTVSMGIAYTYPDGAGSFEELYEEAEQELYKAKRNGRNCIVCDNCVYGRMKNGLGTAVNI